jgi:hypothetical protein
MDDLRRLLSASELESRLSHRSLYFALALLLAYAIFWLLRATYRLTFHPLTSFPGRRWAAVSTWWLYRQESTRHVESILKALHKEYGERCNIQGSAATCKLILTSDTRVLRIGPNELHIDDISVYDEIYSSKYRFMKEPTFYAGFNAPNTVFSEASSALHRERRRMVNPFFSKQGIASMQPLIDDKVNLMVNKICEFQHKGTIHIYSAVRSVQNISQALCSR